MISQFERADRTVRVCVCCICSYTNILYGECTAPAAPPADEPSSALNSILPARTTRYVTMNVCKECMHRCHISIHTHRHRQTQTDTQRHTQTHTDTDTHTQYYIYIARRKHWQLGTPQRRRPPPHAEQCAPLQPPRCARGCMQLCRCHSPEQLVLYGQ